MGTVFGTGTTGEEEALFPEISANGCRTHGNLPEHFHFICPYETDPTKCLRKDWIDEYCGKQYRMTTTGPTGNRYTARVKTFGELLQEYEFHPESKCADSNADSPRFPNYEMHTTLRPSEELVR
jgi:hypothetical protein